MCSLTKCLTPSLTWYSRMYGFRMTMQCHPQNASREYGVRCALWRKKNPSPHLIFAHVCFKYDYAKSSECINIIWSEMCALAKYYISPVRFWNQRMRVLRITMRNHPLTLSTNHKANITIKKWVWLGNASITYCRPTHGIARKRQRTTTDICHCSPYPILLYRIKLMGALEIYQQAHDV